MIAVRAYIADGKRGCIAEFLLNAESVGKNSWGRDIGLDVRRRDEAWSAANRTRDVDIGVGESCIVRCGLIEAIVEIVEQRIVQSKAGMKQGLTVAEDVPRHTYARFR